VTGPLSPVLVDASPLIGLARIDRLDLLRTFPVPIYVTRTVWREVAGQPGRQGVAALIQAEADGILCVIDIGDENAYPDLDAGENATLSAAAEMKAHVIVDERRAREHIRKDAALRSTIRAPLTTIGIVIRAKHEGLIPAVRPILDELRQERFWLSQADYERALHAAGEGP
jgi:predicted nucleic acid-binding protein